jgi:transcriptional regulator with GAF, ATPase, and Fis domain
MAGTAATITMSMREADRLKVMQAVMDRMLRVAPAAKRIGITPRQLERLPTRYKEEGPKPLENESPSRDRCSQRPSRLNS